MSDGAAHQREFFSKQANLLGASILTFKILIFILKLKLQLPDKCITIEST